MSQKNAPEPAYQAELLEHLANEHTPLFTLDELADIVESFGTHLGRNQQHLLQTGYPETRFEASPWFEAYLAKLYPLKLPFRIDEARNKQGEIVYTYSWPSTSLVSLPPDGIFSHGMPITFAKDWETGLIRGADGHPVGAVPFEMAAYPLALGPTPAHPLAAPPEEAKLIEQMRPKLMQLKLDLLAHLKAALYERNAESLWSDTFGLIVAALTSQEMDSLLQLDSQYKLASEGKEGMFRSGGLSSILMLIGHTEKEITIGTLAQTREKLGDTMDRSSLRDREFATADQDTIHEALAQCRTLTREESKFWSKWEKRADAVVQEEREKSRQLAKWVDAAATFAKAMVETTGQLPTHIAPQDAVLEQGNVFRYDRGRWYTIFAGKSAAFDTRRGMSYIQQLLLHPDQPIKCSDLKALKEKASSGTEPSEYSRMSTKQLENEGLSPGAADDLGTIFDQFTLKELKRSLETLDEKLQTEKDPGRCLELNEDRTRIEQYLRSGTNIGGKPRRISSRRDNQRTSVKHAITAALSHIKDLHPELHDHLQAFVKTGSTCRYTPRPPMRWDS